MATHCTLCYDLIIHNVFVQAVAKIFKAYNTDSIDLVRQQCDVPYRLLVHSLKRDAYIW